MYSGYYPNLQGEINMNILQFYSNQQITSPDTLGEDIVATDIHKHRENENEAMYTQTVYKLVYGRFVKMAKTS